MRRRQHIQNATGGYVNEDRSISSHDIPAIEKEKPKQKKGVCEKCQKYIGRGLSVHRKYCK